MQHFKHILNPKHLMAAGAMIVAMGVLMDMPGLPSLSHKPTDDTCQGEVRSEAALSRDQLAKLLTVPEGDKKEKVRAILQEPYCKLPNLEVRAGAVSEREAYLLKFDPQIQLVVLYEGDQYAGYRLNVH